ncbi:MAG: hypothetical protein ACOYUZ_05520 [Patescibacteria group bacterium]
MKKIAFLSLILLIIIGGGCFGKTEKTTIISDKSNCETSEFRFACYLDRAMSAGDPSLCVDLGIDKRLNCLASYAEIMEAEIDCRSLKDPDFITECEMSFANRIDDINNTNATGNGTSLLDHGGLFIEP